jgi:ligand-binding SRPBCC domain-containing protein
LGQGDEMRFTLWLGPLPVEWHARIEQADDAGFVDRQVSGPFKRWIHRHHFEAVDKEMTLVHDTIDVELSDKPFARLLGWLMFRNLPVLFAYRQWRTSRILSEWR